MSNPVKNDLKAARLEKQMPWILISSNHTISWLIHQWTAAQVDKANMKIEKSDYIWVEFRCVWSAIRWPTYNGRQDPFRHDI